MSITMNHGSGGRETARLIHDVFLSAFGNSIGDGTRDAVLLQSGGRLAFTSDGFVVKPLFFRGGDIGKLAVCGTVNDLLTTGATPKYLSASFILEEGLALDDLRRVALSMALTAEEAGVRIVTGDTKVVEGSGGMYISTSGIGELEASPVDFADLKVGDMLIVTGNLSEHHACIMSERMGIENEISSDVAPLCEMVSALRNAEIPLHGMRDITRGGLSTVLCEISAQQSKSIIIAEKNLPISQQVQGLCSILGLDPLHGGNEGNMLIAAPKEHALGALEIVKSAQYGQNAAIVGEVHEGDSVYMETRIGGKRKLHTLSGQSLPRIC